MKEYHTRSLFKIGPFNHHAAAGIFSSAHNFSQIRKEQSMPKNNVSDPITDQEMAFGRLVLSGTMTDRQAADAVGLNPDSAAYTKSKPRVPSTCSSTAPPCSNSSSSKRPTCPGVPWTDCAGSTPTANKYSLASGKSPTSALK